MFTKNKISLENERRYFNAIENVQINVIVRTRDLTVFPQQVLTQKFRNFMTVLPGA